MLIFEDLCELSYSLKVEAYTAYFISELKLINTSKQSKEKHATQKYLLRT